MKHYPFGSSTAARTDACQQWRAQSEGVPQKESTFAIDGTIVHGILEAMALEDPTPDIVEGHRVEKDHLATAREMWDATEQLIEKYKLTEWEPEVTATTAPDVGGTLDLVGTDGNGTAFLLDYKTGMGVQVEALGNKQILFAAANCLYGESSASDLVVGCDKFVGVIMQPGRDGDLRVKVWEFTRDVLDAWWKLHQTNIALAREGEGALCAGDHCKFCPANGLCDATTGNLLRMATLDPHDVENLVWALDHIEAVKTTIKAVEKLAFEQLELGVEIEGWKLVQGRAGNTTWDDPDAALAKLKRLVRGLRTEDDARVATLLETKKMVTPTQAKKILKTAGVATEFLDEITHRPEAKSNVLAPASDKREAVLSTSAFQAAMDSIN